MKLQQALKVLGYYDGVIDGSYGEGTETAVKNLQKKRSMKADGIAGAAATTAFCSAALLRLLPRATAPPT